MKHERRKRRDTRSRIAKMPSQTSKLSEIDYAAVGYRLEQIFQTLTADTVGAKSVRVDRGAFHRVIAHYKRLAKGQIREPGDGMMEDEENTTLRLLYTHNRSSDWVFLGDPGVMILMLAENTNSIRPELRLV